MVVFSLFMMNPKIKLSLLKEKLHLVMYVTSSVHRTVYTIRFGRTITP